MLNQPNERIDEIWKEAQEKLNQPKEDKSGGQMGCYLIWSLICIVGGTLIGGEKGLLTGLVIGPLVGVLSLFEKPGPRNDGGIHDPKFYMPFVMRMVGEILKDEWGEYTCKAGKWETIISFPAQMEAPEQHDGRACAVEYKHVYDTGEDAEDRDYYFLFVAHPVVAYVNAHSGGWSSPYTYLNRRMKGIGSGGPAVLDGVDGWRLCFYEEDYRGPKRKEVQAFGRDEWFAFAQDIADRALKTTKYMKYELNETVRWNQIMHGGRSEQDT